MFDDPFLDGFEFATQLIHRLFGLDLHDPDNSDQLKQHLQQVVSGEIIPSSFSAPPELPPGAMAQMFPNFDAEYKESATRVLDLLETLEQ